MSESLNVILLGLICNANISNTRLTKAELHGELKGFIWHAERQSFQKKDH